jgi:serine/threonine protein kinase
MSDLIGTTLLNRYFLRQLVGSGGTADVYLAWDNMRSAKMAIKVLRRDLANNPRWLHMFAHEAELLSKLEHPNIVRLYEFDQDGENAFIVMDWVDGSNLRQAILNRKKPFPVEEVFHILQPVCSALHFAHQNQVYHCDIKPANILLHSDGRVLLSDFGVARLAYEQIGGGTPPYMAPEQFRCENVSAKTDVYALGITIYEMLSGGLVPFRGDSPNSLGATIRERIAWEHINLPLPPLKSINPEIPDSVDMVIANTLCKEPQRRFATTMALREAFEQALGGGKNREAVFQRQVNPPPAAPVLHPQPKPPSTLPQPAVQPRSTPFHGAHLWVRSGDFAGQVIPISRQGLTIGRGSGSQLQFREASVSRTHAVIIWTKRGVHIRDENSAIGVLLNGQRIPAGVPVGLHHGDVIQVGYLQVLEFREK